MEELTREKILELFYILDFLKIDWNLLRPSQKKLMVEIQKLNKEQLDEAYEYMQAIKK